MTDDTVQRSAKEGRPCESKNLGIRRREIGFGIQMAEGCNARQKFHPVLCKSAKQLHTYMNVLLHKVHGNLRGCIDFNQLSLFVGGQPQKLGVE